MLFRSRENKRFVEEYFRKVSKGDPSVTEDFADDVTWWVPPSSPLSGTYRGKPAVLSLFARGTKLYSPTDPFSVEVQGLVAEGSYVAAQVVIRAITAKGRSYENHYHFLFEIVDGKIKRVKEYVDTLYAQRVLFD